MNFTLRERNIVCIHYLHIFMVDQDINFAKGKIKDNSNKVLAYICHYLFHENHHLYQIYNKKMKLSPYHWWWESVPPVNGPDDVLIGPVPIWPLSVGDHLPHDNSVTPHVTGRRKLPERYGLWCCPPHRNFSTLQKYQLSKNDNTAAYWYIYKEFLNHKNLSSGDVNYP